MRVLRLVALFIAFQCCSWLVYVFYGLVNYQVVEVNEFNQAVATGEFAYYVLALIFIAWMIVREIRENRKLAKQEALRRCMNA